MSWKAVGLIEVQGYSVALAVANQACKAAAVQIEGMDCNNPVMGDQAPIPVVILVKLSGKIDDVTIALEVATEEAKKYIASEDISTHIISSTSEKLVKLLPTGKVKRKQ